MEKYEQSFIESIEKYEQLGYLRQKTLINELEFIVEKYPNKTAIVETNKRVTYRELKLSIDTMAKGFQNLGINKNDNVLVQLPNKIEFIEVCFALFKIGARPILVLPSHRKTELNSIISLAKPVAYILQTEFLGFSYEIMSKTIVENNNFIKYVITIDKRIEGYSNKIKSTTLDNLRDKGIKKDDSSLPREIALFLLSGGTTGTPKLIPKINEAYAYNALASAKRCGITDRSVYMAVLSIAHDYPLCCPGVIGTLLSGGTVVLCQTPSFDEAFEMIEQEKVTFTAIVPAIANLWSEVLEWNDDYDLSSIENILIGAAKLDSDIAKKLIKKFNCKLQQGYGLGEGITCFTSLNDSEDTVFNTQGKPISSGDEIKIIDQFGEEVKNGQSGELIQKGPYTFGGYYKAISLNEKCFDSNGFLHTGDKARITEDGNMEILGRVVEQINRAGENIIPSEIEIFLRKHQYINDAAVIGLPDEELGEKICAFIICDKKGITNDEICTFLYKMGVSQFKMPDQIEVIDKFPFSNIGKVDKKRLRCMMLEKF